MAIVGLGHKGNVIANDARYWGKTRFCYFLCVPFPYAKDVPKWERVSMGTEKNGTKTIVVVIPIAPFTRNLVATTVD